MSQKLTFRRKVYDILQPSHKQDLSHFFDLFIMVLIVLSIVEIMLESVQELNTGFHVYFEIFETVSVVIFTIEYLLRIWTAPENPKFAGLSGRLRFGLTPIAVIDLLAILPFYLPFIGIDLRFLRILRLFRVFRLLKMARYSNAFNLIRNILRDKRADLLVTTSFIIIILIIVSTLMYHIEREVQPEAFSSIPKSLWWGVATLTTVGYGDITPITDLGKFMGGIITLLGVGLIALPSGILASAYTEQILKQKDQQKKKRRRKYRRRKR